MKAIAIVPGQAGVKVVERPEPVVTRSDEVKLRVVEVGICGTDREEASGGRAAPPKGREDLVVGHEMLGRVVEAGRGVSRVKAGDLALFTVRRGCGRCLPCAMNRSDMCLTGGYTERGIWGADGYQTEYVVDTEEYLVRLPPGLEAYGVLTEPLAVAEKAIDEVTKVQLARLPEAQSTPDWLQDRPCLVTGLGPVGLLAAMALRLRGAKVFGLDIVDTDAPKARWLSGIGGTYLDGREVHDDDIGKKIGLMDLILDATGIARLELNILLALGRNGIYVITGIPGGDRPVEVQGAEIIRRLVLDNQVVLGSVNDAPGHFEMAVRDLASAGRVWGADHIAALVTTRFAWQEFAAAFDHPEDEAIKVAIVWGDGEEHVVQGAKGQGVVRTDGGG